VKYYDALGNISNSTYTLNHQWKHATINIDFLLIYKYGLENNSKETRTRCDLIEWWTRQLEVRKEHTLYNV
jgi:hypothetical protein